MGGSKKKNKVSNDDDDNKRTYTMGEYLLLAPDLITVKTNPPFNLLHKSDTLLRLTAFRYFFTYRTLVRICSRNAQDRLLSETSRELRRLRGLETKKRSRLDPVLPSWKRKKMMILGKVIHLSPLLEFFNFVQ